MNEHQQHNFKSEIHPWGTVFCTNARTHKIRLIWPRVRERKRMREGERARKRKGERARVVNERLDWIQHHITIDSSKMARHLVTLFHGANVSNLHYGNSNTISKTNLISIRATARSMPFTNLIQFFLHFRCQFNFCELTFIQWLKPFQSMSLLFYFFLFFAKFALSCLQFIEHSQVCSELKWRKSNSNDFQIKFIYSKISDEKECIAKC